MPVPAWALTRKYPMLKLKIEVEVAMAELAALVLPIGHMFY
jgi:hypothetical protein